MPRSLYGFSLLFIQHGSGFYLSIFILCWKIIADNLKRIKLHGALVAFPFFSTVPLPFALPVPAPQSNLTHSSDGSDKLGEHKRRHYVSQAPYVTVLYSSNWLIYVTTFGTYFHPLLLVCVYACVLVCVSVEATAGYYRIF